MYLNKHIEKRLLKLKKENKRNFYVAIFMLVAFVVWTNVLSFIDIQAIGPNESTVGLGTINNYFRNLIGINMLLYTITDWLSLIPLSFILYFSLLGFIQWIKRKHLKQVDYRLLILGGFYIVVLSIYLFFEIFVLNYRPVLINGILEASYPSSTTILVICVMSTAIIELNSRIENNIIKKCVSFILTVFILFMVVGRMLSGVHWFSDIVGGTLLSTGLVMMYYYMVN